MQSTQKNIFIFSPKKLTLDIQPYRYSTTDVEEKGKSSKFSSTGKRLIFQLANNSQVSLYHAICNETPDAAL